MKTSKLIELLQEADPSGEVECCVDNVDIFVVEPESAYWDGCLEVLDRDWSSEFYNVKGGKYTTKGLKINISTLSVQRALMMHEMNHDTKFPVEIDFTYLNKRNKINVLEKIEQWRAKAAKYRHKRHSKINTDKGDTE